MEIRDPKTKLRTALDILDQYTDARSIEPLIQSIQPQTNGISIRRVVKFASRRIKDHLAQKSKAETVSHIAQAIDDVKRYHPIVNQSVNPEDKKLSKRAIDSIRRFNRLFETPKDSKGPWYQKLLISFVKRISSPLINKTTIHQPNSSLPFTPALRSAAAPQEPLLKQEEDAFRMKAFSLIQRKGIVFPSIHSALNAIRETPIIVCSKSYEKSGSVITLNQTLSPFPGETVILTGSFERNPGTQMPTTPLSESFILETSNRHTGYPFPCQHNGWTLPDLLIPPKPHDIDSIPLLKSLIEKKERIQEALHNQTALKKHAQELILLKEKAAESHLKAFVNLHISFFFALLSAAPAHLAHPNSSSHILNYFSWIKKQPFPYKTLSNDWEKYNERFIAAPAQRLYNAWLKQTEKDLFSSNPMAAFDAAKNILNPDPIHLVESCYDSLESQQFFSSIHAILSVGAQNVYLQYFSEMVDYTPHELNDFEKKLQSLAFTQFEDYVAELEADLPENPFEKMKRSLRYEAEIMNQRGCQHSLVGKLEHYYARRKLFSRP